MTLLSVCARLAPCVAGQALAVARRVWVEPVVIAVQQTPVLIFYEHSVAILTLVFPWSIAQTTLVIARLAEIVLAIEAIWAENQAAVSEVVELVAA